MRLHANPWWDWPAIVNPKGWNWIDFRVIHLSWEWASYRSAFDLCFGLLGFNVEFTLSWGKPEATP
jgi:hypothetical protein